jgi:sulfur-carrier protein
MAVEIRWFAAARAAVGRASDSIPAAPGLTIGVVLADAADGSAETADVLDRCSFLLNARRTVDRATPLGDDDRLDVLPPFAGG